MDARTLEQRRTKTLTLQLLEENTRRRKQPRPGLIEEIKKVPAYSLKRPLFVDSLKLCLRVFFSLRVPSRCLSPPVFCFFTLLWPGKLVGAGCLRRSIKRSYPRVIFSLSVVIVAALRALVSFTIRIAYLIFLYRYHALVRSGGARAYCCIFSLVISREQEKNS